MREILFRAKAINRDPNREYRTNYKNGDWVYGLVEKLPFYDENGEKFFEKDCAHMRNISGVSDIDVDENTICEYTGRKDKNKNEIYNGDIVCFTDKNYPLIVAWYEYKWVLVEPKDTKTKIDFMMKLANECEIIGNIYDNPELVKGENNGKSS